MSLVSRLPGQSRSVPRRQQHIVAQTLSARFAVPRKAGGSRLRDLWGISSRTEPDVLLRSESGRHDGWSLWIVPIERYLRNEGEKVWAGWGVEMSVSIARGDLAMLWRNLVG